MAEAVPIAIGLFAGGAAAGATSSLLAKEPETPSPPAPAAPPATPATIGNTAKRARRRARDRFNFDDTVLAGDKPVPDVSENTTTLLGF